MFGGWFFTCAAALGVGLSAQARNESPVVTTLSQLIAPAASELRSNEWRRLKRDRDEAPPRSMPKWESVGPSYQYMTSVRPTGADESSWQRFDAYRVWTESEDSKIRTQVTFSRLYDGNTEALNAPALFLDRFPFTAEQARVWRPGDAIRIESRTQEPDNRFIAELYRLSEDRIRLRITSVRDAGLLGDISLAPDFRLQPVLKALTDLQPPAPDCGSPSARAPHAPLETLRLDYVFDLSSEVGARVYEQTLRSLGALQLESHFTLLRQTDRAENLLLKYTADAEIKFRSQRSLEPEKRDVDRPLKDLALTVFQATCLPTAQEHEEEPGWQTLRRVYDANSSFTDHVALSNRGDTGTTAWFLPSTTANTPFTGDLRTLDLADWIVTHDLFDSRLQTAERQRLVDSFKATYPAFANAVDWTPLTQGTSALPQTRLRWEFVLPARALEALPDLPAAEVLRRLREFLSTNPESARLTSAATRPDPAFSTSSPSDQALAPPPDFETVQMAAQLTQFLHSRSLSRDLKVFSKLRDNRLYQEIGPGFLLSLIPREHLASVVKFNFVATANGKTLIRIQPPDAQKAEASTLETQALVGSFLGDVPFDLKMQQEARQATGGEDAPQ